MEEKWKQTAVKNIPAMIAAQVIAPLASFIFLG